MRWQYCIVKFSNRMRSKWSSEHETSSQRKSLRTCFNRSIEDHFWHIVVSWISSDSHQCQICIWTLRSDELEIDSFFSSMKKCLSFSIRKISFELLFEIAEKIDISTFVFNIVIRRTNRFYAASKFEIFFDSNVLNRSKMLREMILTSQSWLTQSNMFVFEIWYL
jgi:hypothetical protein